MVYPALLPLMRTPRLPAVDWTDAPRADLNGLVRYAERQNLVSARVPSHFKRSLPSNVNRSLDLSTLKGQTTHRLCQMSKVHYRVHKILPHVQSQRIPKQKPSLSLTLILLRWRIWWAPDNATKWQMGYNSAFKWLIMCVPCSLVTPTDFVWTNIQCTYCTQHVTLHCPTHCTARRRHMQRVSVKLVDIRRSSWL